MAGVDVRRVEAGRAEVHDGSCTTGARVIGEFHCSDCGYGIVSRGALPVCPMCGGSSWDESVWRPFNSFYEAC